MTKNTEKPAEHKWAISRIRGTPAELLGHIYAPDAETAIAKAIEEFEITNPEHRKRLIAQRT